jgi:hypothetical protein
MRVISPPEIKKLHDIQDVVTENTPPHLMVKIRRASASQSLQLSYPAAFLGGHAWSCSHALSIWKR